MNIIPKLKRESSFESTSSSSTDDAEEVCTELNLIFFKKNLSQYSVDKILHVFRGISNFFRSMKHVFVKLYLTKTLIYNYLLFKKVSLYKTFKMYFLFRKGGINTTGVESRVPDGGNVERLCRGVEVVRHYAPI